MHPRLRIAFLAPGSDVHTQRWVEAMVGRGHAALLITPDPMPPTDAEVFDPFSAMGGWARVPKLRAFIAERLILRRVRTFAPDLVHLHWLNPTLGTLRIARRVHPLAVSVWGRDVIWDGNEPEPRFRVYCKSRILARAAMITATSNFLARATARFAPAGRTIHVIPFGVDGQRFQPSPPGEGRSIPVIGYLKRYAPKYGPDILLRAASLLARKGLAFRVEMYGGGDAEPSRRLAAALELDDRVGIFGRVGHDLVPETLRRFDIFAMPSIYDSETFGVAAVEAASCGLPVVATRVGGVPEVVIDGTTGHLVAPADPAALADVLERLLSNAALRREMGEAGRRFVLANYPWQECVDRMEALYEGLRAQSKERLRPTAADA